MTFTNRKIIISILSKICIFMFFVQMAKRALVQAAARELGPRGVHVAHVIVDGVVDNPNTRKYFQSKVLRS